MSDESSTIKKKVGDAMQCPNCKSKMKVRVMDQQVKCPTCNMKYEVKLNTVKSIALMIIYCLVLGSITLELMNYVNNPYILLVIMIASFIPAKYLILYVFSPLTPKPLSRK